MEQQAWGERGCRCHAKENGWKDTKCSHFVNWEQSGILVLERVLKREEMISAAVDDSVLLTNHSSGKQGEG